MVDITIYSFPRGLAVDMIVTGQHPEMSIGFWLAGQRPLLVGSSTGPVDPVVPEAGPWSSSLIIGSMALAAKVSTKIQHTDP